LGRKNLEITYKGDGEKNEESRSEEPRGYEIQHCNARLSKSWVIGIRAEIFDDAIFITTCGLEKD
jgi:hypothetical protein